MLSLLNQSKCNVTWWIVLICDEDCGPQSRHPDVCVSTPGGTGHQEMKRERRAVSNTHTHTHTPAYTQTAWRQEIREKCRTVWSWLRRCWQKKQNFIIKLLKEQHSDLINFHLMITLTPQWFRLHEFIQFMRTCTKWRVECFWCFLNKWNPAATYVNWNSSLGKVFVVV